MKARAAWPLCFVAALVAALLVGAAPRLARAEGEVALAVIVSPRSRLTQLTGEELRRMFQGERVNDPEGNRLIALNHPPHSADRVGFDRAVLRRGPDEVGRFWVERKKKRGADGPPRVVESLATLRRVVEKLPGALGYIRPTQLTNEVRAIRVDGKLPEDPGYLVRYRP